MAKSEQCGMGKHNDNATCILHRGHKGPHEWWDGFGNGDVIWGAEEERMNCSKCGKSTKPAIDDFGPHDSWVCAECRVTGQPKQNPKPKFTLRVSVGMIERCPRCHGIHTDEVEFYEFNIKPEIQDTKINYYGFCPLTKHPILMWLDFSTTANQKDPEFF